MKNSFSYNILTYRHSVFLGEILNVGVLFIFPEKNLLEFHFPNKINRINKLYSDFNEKLVFSYLKSFELKSKLIKLDIYKYPFDFNKILTENFIIKDSSALQFGTFRTGVYYSSIEEVKKRYIELILGNYTS